MSLSDIGRTSIRRDFAPFRQNLLRDSATQGTEKATEKASEQGAKSKAQ
jgi:hypothetical protein